MIKIKLKKEQWDALGWWNPKSLTGSGYLGKVDGIMECYLVPKKKVRTTYCVKCGVRKNKKGRKRCSVSHQHQFFYYK